MKRFINFYVLVLMTNIFVISIDLKAENPQVIPQAQPFIWLVKSILEDKIDSPQLIWDKPLIEKVNRSNENISFSKLLSSYKKIWSDYFGDFKIEDFSFAYEGNENEGFLIISFNGKNAGKIKVVKDSDSNWKLAEF